MPSVDQRVVNWDPTRKLLEELRDNVAPCFLPKRQVKGLDRFLCRLVAGKACPLVTARVA